MKPLVEWWNISKHSLLFHKVLSLLWQQTTPCHEKLLDRFLHVLTEIIGVGSFILWYLLDRGQRKSPLYLAIVLPFPLDINNFGIFLNAKCIYFLVSNSLSYSITPKTNYYICEIVIFSRRPKVTDKQWSHPKILRRGALHGEFFNHTHSRRNISDHALFILANA